MSNVNTIEHLQLTWKGDGIKTDDNYRRRLPERTWEDTADVLFHKSAIELCEEISPHTLKEKYAEIVETEIEPIKEVLPVPDGNIRIGNVSSNRRSRVYYNRGESVIVPSHRFNGVVHLVSNNKNAARDLRGKLVNELEKKAKQYHGIGVEEVNIYTEESFTLQNIEHENADLSLERNEPGEFEEQILDELKPLSESFVGNLVVDFIDYSPSPEFDVIYPINPHQFVQIEIKDYSGTNDEPGEKEAIQNPLRRASLLDIVQTITVVRGVGEDRLSELKNHSELRNQIDIIEKHEVEETIKPLLEQSVKNPPYLMR